jgi:hypothetical protein
MNPSPQPSRSAHPGPVPIRDVLRRSGLMKTAILPPIRLEPELRDRLEAAPNSGESLGGVISAACVSTDPAARARRGAG